MHDTKSDRTISVNRLRRSKRNIDGKVYRDETTNTRRYALIVRGSGDGIAVQTFDNLDMVLIGIALIAPNPESVSLTIVPIGRGE